MTNIRKKDLQTELAEDEDDDGKPPLDKAGHSGNGYNVQLTEEQMWEMCVTEGHDWNKRTEKPKPLDSWHTPVHPLSTMYIADNDFLQKLDAKDNLQNNYEVENSTCICGKAKSIDQCVHCIKVFACSDDDHKNCSLQISSEANVDNEVVSSTPIKFSCGKILLNRYSITSISNPEEVLQKKYAKLDKEKELAVKGKYKPHVGISGKKGKRRKIVMKRIMKKKVCKTGLDPITLGEMDSDSSSEDTISESSEEECSTLHALKVSDSGTESVCKDDNFQSSPDKPNDPNKFEGSLSCDADATSNITADHLIASGSGTTEINKSVSVKESSYCDSDDGNNVTGEKSIASGSGTTESNKSSVKTIIGSSDESEEELPLEDRLPVLLEKIYIDNLNKKKLSSNKISLLLLNSGIHNLLNPCGPTFDKLIPGPTVQELMKCKKGVHVTQFRSFNKVNLVSSKGFTYHIPLLRQDIYYEMTIDPEEKWFQHPPNVGTVLLAPLKDHFGRAVVKTIEHNSLVGVFFFDVGNEEVVPYKKCFQIGDELVKVPIQGVTVSLKDVTTEKTDRMLQSDFDRFVKKWPESRTCIIKSVESVGDEEVVELNFDSPGRFSSISAAILDLAKWEWERRWEREVRIDEEILCDEKKWHEECRTVRFREFPVDRNIDVTVVSGNSEIAEVLVLFNVETEDYSREKKVLQLQFEHYLKFVGENGKTFYPALGQQIWVYILPNDDEIVKDLRGVGKWSRCVREGDMLWNVDEHEFYPIKVFRDPLFKLRKCCPNFNKIPIFMRPCILKDCLPTNGHNKLIFNTLAKPGKVLSLRGLGLDPEGNEVTCEDYKECHERLLELMNESTDKAGSSQ